jgi:8-oxo-dGTP pyrophosphatase MutT (NUDIX family)
MSAEDRRFEHIGGDTVYEGKIVTLRIERYRYADGDEVERETVRHGGAAAIVAHDDTHVWLVRQPREAAKRELAEEIGKAAERWETVLSYVSSAGMSDEVIHIFHATGLSDRAAEADENERIEIVRWPLDDLDGAIAATRDAKTLIALLWLKLDRG